MNEDKFRPTNKQTNKQTNQLTNLLAISMDQSPS